jgi:hypothetical protein
VDSRKSYRDENYRRTDGLMENLRKGKGRYEGLELEKRNGAKQDDLSCGESLELKSRMKINCECEISDSVSKIIVL